VFELTVSVLQLVRLVKKYKTETVETDDAPTEAGGCCVLF
jgi:hypothetical protein